MSFRFKRLKIPSVILIEPKLFKDERGSFAEIFKSTDFAQQGIQANIVQVNHSRSGKHVLRGLHYQIPPKAQAKWVSVIAGKIYDVAVDLRKGSPTFGQWVGCELDAEKKHMLFIPEGFAHGFCALSDGTQVVYYCSEVYSPEHERGLAWNDPALKIKWPVRKPILSPRDEQHGCLKDLHEVFLYESQ